MFHIDHILGEIKDNNGCWNVVYSVVVFCSKYRLKKKHENTEHKWQ